MSAYLKLQERRLTVNANKGEKFLRKTRSVVKKDLL